MPVNQRKNIQLRNRTNYFNPDTSRSVVEFSSPYTYLNRKQKIEGYENRLYWEYRYCDEHSGMTYFYTLTYNDAHIPQYDGENCFDYEDLRSLMNGAFKKYILRNYGYNFKYFIGAELGDGKGSRGMANNPHYHVLFFLRPDDRYHPTVELTPERFRHLVRRYWQGFDEDEDKRNGVFHDYRDAKLGIAREGENCGVVTDFRACMYCAKYVTKDVHLKKKEKIIERDLRCKLYEQVKFSHDTYEAFWKEEINPRYNAPTKPHLDDINHDDWLFTPYELWKNICPNSYANWLTNFGDIEPELHLMVMDAIAELNLVCRFQRFIDLTVSDKIHEKITEYRNRYCNKCRISQGVGDYALEFIDDLLNPRVKVPAKKGWKTRPIGMYYYRKLYTEVVKDEYGNNIRILNDKGIDYKVSKMPAQVEKLSQQTLAQVASLTRELYNRMLNSDVNTDVNFSYTYDRFIDDMNNKDKKIYDDYAKFKLIYEHRYCSLNSSADTDDFSFPPIDYLNDYRRFLRPAILDVTYSKCRTDIYIDDTPEGYTPYYTHPYFLQNLRVFSVFNLLADYLFCEGDAVAQQDAQQIADTKRFHDKQKINEFYANFLN